MSPLKDFHLAYNVFNEEETFSEGDVVGGTFSFTLTKETTVKTILVSVRGLASVSWDEGTGDDKRSYHDHRQYFEVKEYIVPKISGGSKLPQGPQRFNFQLVIPPGATWEDRIYTQSEDLQDLADTYKNRKRAQLLFKVSSKQWPNADSLCKDVGLFSKAKVQLFVTMNKNIYSPGETANVVVKTLNQSSKNMRPKVKLQQRIEYRAGSSTTDSHQSWYKHVGDTINANSEGTFTCQVQIPADVISTIRNCEIISVEYYLRVYLDISFAIDPKLQLPLIIIPSRFANLYSAGAVWAPTHSDFPPPIPSSSYGYPAPYLTPSGLPSFENQGPVPQAVRAQEEQPPSYQSLWPPDNNYDCPGSTKK